MNRSRFYFGILLLLSQAAAANPCAIRLGSDPKVSDIENALRCLSEKIATLEQLTQKSGFSAVQGETWKVGNCLSYNKNEKFNESIVVEVQQSNQNPSPIKLCWKDGVIFSRIKGTSGVQIYIETPGGENFTDSSRNYCAFGHECTNKEHSSLTYLAEALQDAKGRGLVKLNISNDPN